MAKQTTYPIFLFGLIALGLFLFGCSQPQQGGSSTNAPSAPVDLNSCLNNCPGTSDTPVHLATCKISCYTDLADQTKNPANCDPILQQEYDSKEASYAACVSGAGATDPTLCNKLSAGQTLSYCLADIGARIRSTSPCDVVRDAESFGKDFCISDIAYSLKDPSLCEQISDSTKKSSCQSRARS